MSNYSIPVIDYVTKDCKNIGDFLGESYENQTVFPHFHPPVRRRSAVCAAVPGDLPFPGLLCPVRPPAAGDRLRRGRPAPGAQPPGGHALGLGADLLRVPGAGTGEGNARRRHRRGHGAACGAGPAAAGRRHL